MQPCLAADRISIGYQDVQNSPEMLTRSPSVTAILLSYNCQEFIGEALESVLAQNYDHLDIFISDDASEDDTFSILQRDVAQYDGNHRITLNRRPSNSGSKTAHLNSIFGRISADIVIFFDGDDISKPCRAKRLVKAFCEDENAYAVYSAFSFIGKSGKPLGQSRVPHPEPGTNTQEWFARVDAYAAGGTLAIRRPVFKQFGEMDPAVNEDIILPFRASLLGTVRFLDAQLVTVRRHAGSLTTNRESYNSIENYRARMRLGIAMACSSARMRLADIETALILMPAKAEEFTALQGIVLSSRADAELTGDLVSPSFVSRYLALIKLLKAGAYRDTRLEHAVLALSPTLYLRYQRQRFARKIS